MSYSIGDKVIIQDKDGIFLIRSEVQNETGMMQYYVQSTGNEDDAFLVDSSELNMFNSGAGDGPESTLASKIAYSDFMSGDKVSFKIGSAWVKGKIVGGMSGRNQSYLVSDELGIIHEVQGNWLAKTGIGINA